jgi:hypothetical protein
MGVLPEVVAAVRAAETKVIGATIVPVELPDGITLTTR